MTWKPSRDYRISGLGFLVTKENQAEKKPEKLGLCEGLYGMNTNAAVLGSLKPSYRVP